ncbi:MAG: retropepsin-like aspartic protease [Lamprobacter sp.]|uniref:retropepsin-like aspartic protease family protein n=1 Tax=Lamprobacter sp. TaxID=3100796 RepID=UPI002B258A03|nr:retropepsin-like aspartic protease [Lamprobacter sp.]MEA3639112.1 retropepsin-like aspartic protease [Lamprobacter sp.]
MGPMNAQSWNPVCVACASLLLFWLSVPLLAAQVEIAPELNRLSAAHGFSVTGIEVIEDERGRSEEVDLFRRLRVLLERFDHILVHGASGEVARVIIMGRTNRAPPPKMQLDPEPSADAVAGQIELETIREGAQHSVRVTLEGAGGRRVDRTLLIDTGADAVVLPASMIAPLGLDQSTLSEREVQTANGRTQALMGTLEAVWLDGERLPGVAVAFIEVDKLGVSGLLGMSVLGRYQMTINDENNRLTLRPNRASAGASSSKTQSQTSSP